MTTSIEESRFWVHIVSLDHVRQSVAGAFIQSSQGEKDRLAALSRRDYVVFYSPRTKFRKGKPLQEFSALGMVEDGEPYRVQGGQGDLWQCHMTYLDAQPVSLQSLVDDLAFIPDKERWELPYSRGLFEIEQGDFLNIARAMGVMSELALQSEERLLETDPS